MEDFVNELIASEEQPTGDTKEVTKEEVVKDEVKEVKAETEEQDSDDEAYLDLDDEDETDENPEESEETDEEDEDSKEEATGDVDLDTEFTFKADGEEVTVSVKELQKSYGLQKNLTRKGQELAEKEKAIQSESDVIAYYKQTPERQKIQDQIKFTQEAVDRGFYFDNEGNQVKMTQSQIDNTRANLEKKKEEFSKMSAPPKLEQAMKEIPEIFSTNVRPGSKEADTISKYENYLLDIGYTKSEFPHVSPRELLLVKRALEGDELAARVEARKARLSKKTKPGVVSKVTKAAKGKPETSTNKGNSKPKKSEQQIADKVNNGEMSIIDAFMDLDD